MAQALQELESPRSTLTQPTALSSNYTLEPITNPEPLAPAYAAFLAANRLCTLSRGLQLQVTAERGEAPAELLIAARV